MSDEAALCQSQFQNVSFVHVENLGKNMVNIIQQKVQAVSHQNTRASRSDIIKVFEVLTTKKIPRTFRKLDSILVQVKIWVDAIHSTMSREGDGVVSRSEAGEDTRVEVELATSSARAISIVEVGKEGFKGHGSVRILVSTPPGRDEDDWKVTRRWFRQGVF